MGLDATGISLSFGTSSFTAEVTDINQGDISRPDLDDTDHDSSNMEFQPGALVDYGEITIDMKFDPDSQPPVTADPETITFTFPKKDSGSASGATVSGSGYIKSWSWGEATVNNLLTAQMVWKWDGKTAPSWSVEA